MADDDEQPESSSNSDLKFRNYHPQTKFLDGYYTLESTEPESITSLIQDKLDLIECETIEKDFKKIDYDLKCRIEKKLDRLERDTKRQISKHNKGSK